MSTQVALAGGAVVISGTASEMTTMYTPQSITVALALTSVFPPQSHLKRADGKAMTGVLIFTLYIEGTATSRIRQDAVSPTAAVGNLISAAPVNLVLRGWDQMARTVIIGTAAGNTITGSIAIDDVRN